jgi:hypothetical protein
MDDGRLWRGMDDGRLRRNMDDGRWCCGLVLGDGYAL